MKQIETLLQTLMTQSVKERVGKGFIKVDNHYFDITVEFRGYLEQPIEAEVVSKSNVSNTIPIESEEKKQDENPSVPR